jgi:predicted DNA-binding protein
VKTERVRIKVDKYGRLKMLADLTGHTVDYFLDRAVDLFFSQEAPVYEQAHRQVQEKIASGRQHVHVEVA